MSDRQPRILMCRPEYYGIEYEINPWMKVERGSNRALAQQQWEALYRLILDLGGQIALIDPVPGQPDMVFTANAGVVFQDRFVPSRFRHAERQGESPHFARWFADQGFRVIELASHHAFEGAGDALFCGETLYAGYLYRSEVAAHQELAALLGCEALSLELVDPRFYHLDTCFCPLAPGEAIYYPPAFDDYARRVLAETIPLLIAATDADAERFGCNAVVIGKDVILNTGTDALAAQLRRYGYAPHQTELGEFLKSGGSAKCLTLRLDGEEAAAWAIASPAKPETTRQLRPFDGPGSVA